MTTPNRSIPAETRQYHIIIYRSGCSSGHNKMPLGVQWAKSGLYTSDFGVHTTVPPCQVRIGSLLGQPRNDFKTNSFNNWFFSNKKFNLNGLPSPVFDRNELWKLLDSRVMMIVIQWIQLISVPYRAFISSEGTHSHLPLFDTHSLSPSQWPRSCRVAIDLPLECEYLESSLRFVASFLTQVSLLWMYAGAEQETGNVSHTPNYCITIRHVFFHVHSIIISGWMGRH